METQACSRDRQLVERSVRIRARLSATDGSKSELDRTCGLRHDHRRQRVHRLYRRPLNAAKLLAPTKSWLTRMPAARAISESTAPYARRPATRCSLSSRDQRRRRSGSDALLYRRRASFARTKHLGSERFVKIQALRGPLLGQTEEKRLLLPGHAVCVSGSTPHYKVGPPRSSQLRSTSRPFVLSR